MGLETRLQVEIERLRAHGFTVYQYRRDGRRPDRLAAARYWPEYADVVLIRGAISAVAYRTPVGPDAFTPTVVTRATVGTPLIVLIHVFDWPTPPGGAEHEPARITPPLWCGLPPGALRELTTVRPLARLQT